MIKSSLVCIFSVLFFPHFIFSQHEILNNLSIHQADSLYEAGKYNLAIEACNQLQKEGFRENDTALILSYVTIAKSHFGLRNFSKTINYGKKAIALSDQLNILDYKGLISNTIGLSYIRMNNFDKGLEIMEAVLQLEVEAKNDKGIARAYYYLGGAYSAILKQTEALNYFKKATSLSIKVNGPNHKETARYKLALGSKYRILGMRQQAITNVKEGLDILRTHLGETHPKMIVSYVTLGRTYSSFAAYNKAEDAFFKALDVFKANFPAKKDGLLALIYSNISTNYVHTLELQKALQYGEKALEIRKLSLASMSPKFMASYSTLGIIKTHLKQYDEALMYFNKELVLHRYYGVNNNYHADVYIRIGNLFHQQKRYTQALDYYTEAISIYDLATKTSPLLIGQGLSRLANTYEDMGNLNQALTHYQKSYALLDSSYSQYHPEVAILHCKQASIYSKIGSIPQARRELQQAAASFKYDSRQPYVFKNVSHLRELSYYFKAKQLFYRLQDSIPSFKDSILDNHLYHLAAIQARHVRISNSDAREFYNESIYNAYEEAIQDFSNSDRDSQKEMAFSIAERSKKMQLGKEYYHALTELLSDSLKEVNRTLKESINACEKQLFELEKTQQGETLEQNRVLYTDSLIDLRTQQDHLLNSIEQEIPNYYDLNVKSTPLRLKQCQERLHSNQTLLEYFVGDSSLYVFVVNQKSYQVQQIPLHFSLKDEIQQLRSGIYDFYTVFNGSDSLYKICKQNYTNAASQLYKQLVQPIEGQLKGEVIVIADDLLNFIPFEALLTDKVSSTTPYSEMPYWVKAKTISYEFSASEMLLREKRTRKKLDNKVAVFAPSYQRNKKKMRKKYKYYTSLRFDLAPLQYNIPEAKSISQVYDAALYLDSLANKQNFEATAKHYSIVHLATHAKSYTAKSKYSYVAFSSDRSANDLNNMLFVDDLYQMKLENELVVLSACETGIGELKKGKGVVSLSKALAFAGVRSQVASLWKIDDESTGSFMPQFYEGLNSGLAKHTALRNSKLQFINKEKYAAPFFWAAYTLNGDTTPTQVKHTKLYIILIGFLLLISLFFFYKKRKSSKHTV